MISEITDPRSDAAGWVLYDGRCGFCSAAARRAASLLGRMGLVCVPAQTPCVAHHSGGEVPSAEADSTGSSAARELTLVTRDGRVLLGIDAYLFVADQLWWARPLVRIGRRRAIHRLLRRAYAWIAVRRRRISATCRLRADLPDGTEVRDDRRLLH